MNTTTESPGADAPGEAVELLDVEEFAKANPHKKPPRAKRYRIRIDKVRYEVEVAAMTGRELLLLAGKTPPERYSISQKLHGGQSRPVGLDEDASFAEPGVERFMTLPLDQTEG